MSGLQGHNTKHISLRGTFVTIVLKMNNKNYAHEEYIVRFTKDVHEYVHLYARSFLDYQLRYISCEIALVLVQENIFTHVPSHELCSPTHEHKPHTAPK